jgi:hypothetical protein
MFRKSRLRLRALFHRDDVNQEYQAHLDQLTDELIQEGMSRSEARMEARRRFGNVGQLEEQSHDLFSFALLDDISRDLKYAWRSIRRTPSVAVAAILSIGLAAGVNTVVFSVIRDIFFSQPTTRDAGRLIGIQLGGSSHASLPNMRDLDESGIFERVAGFDVETSVNWLFSSHIVYGRGRSNKIPRQWAAR